MSKGVDISIKKRISELKVDVLFCKKGHYNAAGIWNGVHYTLGIATAGLAAFIGVKNSTLSTGTIALLAMTVAALGAISTFLKPQEKAAQHKQSGDDFDYLLQQLSNFNEVEMLQGNDSDHTIGLKLLTDQKTKLNKNALQIPRLAYLKAKDGIEKGEAAYVEKI
ncbi:MAG TPA: SLATT domain-containing protein [Candidatus Saccharimonadales bacterium]|nr:SLATT domain-containing protein [Candidatus Saccharimonadales bacterium]